MPAWPPTARHPSKSEWGQDPRRILEVRKLYAVGILVYFAAGGILAISISDFTDWASFMGRHAVYAVAWPAAAVAEINSWREPSGLLRSLR